MADIKDISTPDLLKSISLFGDVNGLKYTETDMEDIRSLGRDQIEKEYKRIMGGTKLTKKKSKSKSKPTKVATAKHGGLAKRGYGVARRG
tara:strand:- start:1016 stop:1285 length:270 start_codon:yes stop_codon:yes gene_type:complete